MDKRFWAIIGVIIVIFGGILALHGHQSSTDGSKKTSGQPTQHVEGNTSSKVTLQEYGDYECPVCENYYQVVQQVQQKYNDTVRFQFSNLPLLQIHPNAFAGARAAEAADMQGKFWQMHDLLYTSSNWSEWSTSSNPTKFFWSYAQQLGLNVTKFKSDFASGAVNDRINADISAFKATGQQESTPSFFINGKYYSNSNFVDGSGSPSVAAFSKIIDTALKNAK
jgi:protein-disulfide isomerase